LPVADEVPAAAFGAWQTGTDSTSKLKWADVFFSGLIGSTKGGKVRRFASQSQVPSLATKFRVLFEKALFVQLVN
jgi:hypothetical protein